MFIIKATLYLYIPVALHTLGTVKNNIDKYNIILIIDKIRSRSQPSSQWNGYDKIRLCYDCWQYYYNMYEYVSTFCNGRPCPNPNCLQVIYPFQSSCGSYKFNWIHSLEKIFIAHQSLKIKHLQGSCELFRLSLILVLTSWLFVISAQCYWVGWWPIRWLFGILGLDFGLWTGTWTLACLMSMFNIKLMSNILIEDSLLCQTS